MKPSPCQSLDDYLNHDLGGEGRARFVAHLMECSDCRRAVEDHERLATLLVEATRSVPAGLTERVERRLRRVRRRRIVATAAALAAALAGVWLLGRYRPRPEQPSPPLADVRPEPPAAPEAPRPADRVRVSFPPGANVLAVPVETESPNVTFVWVYPNLRAANRPAPDERREP
jgi:hypothetical protein